MSDKAVEASERGWIAQHRRRYLESNGADGHLWDSTPVGGPGPIPTLLLTTVGRKSGQRRIMPLIYGETAGGYVVIASRGGYPTHPAWYLNLLANPEVDVQVGAERLRARARTAQGEERTRLWAQQRALFPPYDDYQAKTQRQIPVVVLERIAT